MSESKAQKEQRGIWSPENYHEVSKPFESVEAAAKAIDDFFEEFYELRNKHRISDVYAIARVLTPDGERTARMMAGNEYYAETLTAWAFGFEQSQRQERIWRIIDETTKATKHKSRK